MAYYDFIHREIEGISRVLATVLFQKGPAMETIIDEHGVLSGDDYLLYILTRLLGEGKINEAENILHEALEYHPTPETLYAAMVFYKKLNDLSDEALAASDFSREEIAEGLADARRLYDANQARE